MGYNYSYGGGSYSYGGSYSSYNGKVEFVFINRIIRSVSLFIEKQNINVRVVFIYVLGDIVQSVGVFIVVYIIKFKVKYFFIYDIVLIYRVIKRNIKILSIIIIGNYFY